MLLRHIPDEPADTCTAHICIVDHLAGRKRTMGHSGRASGIRHNTEQSLQKAKDEAQEVRGGRGAGARWSELCP